MSNTGQIPASLPALVKTGDDTLTLDGDSSTFSGSITVQAGALEAKTPATLGGDSNFSKVTVDTGATLAVAVGAPSDWYSGQTDDIAALLGSATFQADAVLGIDTTDGNFTYPAGITDTHDQSHPLGLCVFGGNTLILAGANTYSDGTVVTASTLDVQGSIGGTVLTTDGQLVGPGAPSLPAVNVDSAGVCAVIGLAAANTVEYTAPTGDDVSLAASEGDLTQNDDGTWAWNWTPDDASPGPQTVTITATDAAGNSAAQTFTVDWLASTATTVGVVWSANVNDGAPVTLGAMVSASAGAATGSVDFYDGTTFLGTVGLNAAGELNLGGESYAVLTVPSLDLGDHGLTAVYDGDNYCATSTALPIVVTVSPTSNAPTLTLTGSPTATEGVSYALGLLANCASGVSVSQWTVDWGDGTTRDILPGNSTSDTHVYQAGGATYSIYVTETDSAGYTYTATLENNVAGGLDSQFAASGPTPGVISGAAGSYAGLVVQPDGSIVACGAGCQPALARWDATGVPDDTTFTDVSGQIPSITAVAIQPEGNSFQILAAGYSPLLPGEGPG